MRKLTLAAVLIVAVGSGAGVALGVMRGHSSSQVPALAAEVLVSPKPFAGYTLVDQDAQTFDERDFLGKWSFVFFGYTHCPDICPMTLSLLKQVKTALKDDGESVADLQVVFISVDPARDTPNHLRDYVHYFDQGFVGVTGAPDQIHIAETDVGAVHKFGAKDANGQYEVNHSSYIYLIDPLGRLYARFNGIDEVPHIVERYLAVRHYYAAGANGGGA
ncbi:MAG: SCO family protein [Gammaproteobacteria bacterium]